MAGWILEDLEGRLPILYIPHIILWKGQLIYSQIEYWDALYEASLFSFWLSGKREEVLNAHLKSREQYFWLLVCPKSWYNSRSTSRVHLTEVNQKLTRCTTMVKLPQVISLAKPLTPCCKPLSPPSSSLTKPLSLSLATPLPFSKAPFSYLSRISFSRALSFALVPQRKQESLSDK